MGGRASAMALTINRRSLSYRPSLTMSRGAISPSMGFRVRNQSAVLAASPRKIPATVLAMLPISSSRSRTACGMLRSKRTELSATEEIRETACLSNSMKSATALGLKSLPRPKLRTSSGTVSNRAGRFGEDVVCVETGNMAKAPWAAVPSRQVCQNSPFINHFSTIDSPAVARPLILGISAPPRFSMPSRRHEGGRLGSSHQPCTFHRLRRDARSM